jgi:MSHA biogenesis protein MshQ
MHCNTQKPTYLRILPILLACLSGNVYAAISDYCETILVDVAGTLPYLGVDTGVDFLVHTSGTLSLPAGDYTIYVESDNGFSFVMDTLNGDTVSFSKFGDSISGTSNELRHEDTIGNSNTGGSFTLTQYSVFDISITQYFVLDISAIFFELGDGDYLEIYISNDIRTNETPSGYEILRHGALNGKVEFGQCTVTSQIDHYRIEHDAQGFTCEAETVTIKACADANCDTLYEQETTITLSDLGLAGDGWMSGNEITIPAGTDIPITLSVTDEGNVTFSKTSANPNANLRCFNGSIETCDMTFSDDGFEIYGANIDEPLADQLAANHFQDVNLRAVRSSNNACEALLVGTQTVDLTYNCVSPDECVTPLSNIAINGDGSGDNTGTLSVVFDDQGVANLSGLNYPDAGRLTLSVAAEVEGVTIENSSNKTVDIYPSYLQLAVSQNNSIAAEPFTLSIGAYGVNDALLPNYKAGASKLKIKRVTPNSSDAHDGNFKYGDASTSIMSTDLAATFASTSPYPLVFSSGVYSSTQAYFDDVGSVEIDIQDANYLGNIIPSQGALSIGNFVPAYFSVTQMQPELQDTCEDTFSYIGETMGFVTGLEPLLIFTGKNALDAVTKNYSASPWTFNLNQLDVDNGIYLSDSSTYAATDSFNEISKGSPPVISTGSVIYDGIIEVQIPDTRFKYNKIRSDNTTFNIKSPFTASIDMVFSSTFLTDEDGVCYQIDYDNSNCLSFTIPNITGANMRYGRLVLASTYGPETESLNVPVKVEYVDTNNQWLINSEDNCTSISFSEAAGDMILESIGSMDITEDIIDISSNGLLFEGVSNDNANFLLINPKNKIGEVRLRLSPTASGVVWPTYLNYDWDDDGSIDTNDFPEANVTFGQFRGNDKIIQWREVFD